MSFYHIERIDKFLINESFQDSEWGNFSLSGSLSLLILIIILNLEILLMISLTSFFTDLLNCSLLFI